MGIPQLSATSVTAVWEPRGCSYGRALLGTNKRNWLVQAGSARKAGLSPFQAMGIRRSSVGPLTITILISPVLRGFSRSGGVWSEQTKRVANNGIGNAEQGYSVSLSGNGNIAIVGGRFDNENSGDLTGAAWVYARSGGVWSQQ